jgi:hypothetical protein
LNWHCRLPSEYVAVALRIKTYEVVAVQHLPAIVNIVSRSGRGGLRNR